MSSEDTRFKPGQSGNPLGRIKMPEDILAARKQNKIEFERGLHKIVVMTPSELEALARDPNSSVLQLLIAKIWAEAIKKGDEKRAAFLLSHMGIVVKQKISLDGGEDDEGNAKPIQLSRIDLDERLNQLKNQLPPVVYVHNHPSTGGSGGGSNG